MEEIWKQIPGFEKYEVSSLGRVKSFVKSKERILCTKSYGYKYMNVSLRGPEKLVTRRVHRLVAEAFLGPLPDGMETCHINGNSHDNRLENLKYATLSENQLHRLIHGTDIAGEKHHNTSLTEKQVLEIRKKYKRTALQESNSKQLAEEYRVSKSTINNILKRRTWKHLKETP